MFQLERRKLWSSGMLGAGIPWEHSLRILLTVYPSWSRRFTSLPPRRTLPYRRVSKAAPSPLADLSLREMKVSNCFMFLHRCPEKAGGGLSGLGGCNFDRGESNTLVGDIGVSFSLCRTLQGTEKNNEKIAKIRAQPPQPRYQPPLRSNNPGKYLPIIADLLTYSLADDGPLWRRCSSPAGPAYPRRPPVRVSEAAAKLGQMTLGGPASRPQQAVWRQQEGPPPMKAGGWHGQPDLLGRPHEIPAAARTASRKVVSWSNLPWPSVLSPLWISRWCSVVCPCACVPSPCPVCMW